MIASLSKAGKKDGAYLVCFGPFSTLGDLARFAYADQEQKRFGKVDQKISKTTEKVVRRIGQDERHVLIRLVIEHFENEKRHLNKQRKLQITNCTYTSCLIAPSLANVERTDCLSIEDTGQSYLQEAVATIFYYGSRNARFDSVIVSAKQPCTGAARECTPLKSSVWFGYILVFV